MKSIGQFLFIWSFVRKPVIGDVTLSANINNPATIIMAARIILVNAFHPKAAKYNRFNAETSIQIPL
jgi:hypothetical protein